MDKALGFFCRRLAAGTFALGVCGGLWATPHNIAPRARVSASSAFSEAYGAEKAVDGVLRVSDKGEWAAGSRETFWGQINYPWIQLAWERPVAIDRVVLYDRPREDAHTAGGARARPVRGTTA